MSLRSPKGSFGSLPLATGVAPISLVVDRRGDELDLAELVATRS
jgi:hypothetical protein